MFYILAFNFLSDQLSLKKAIIDTKFALITAESPIKTNKVKKMNAI